MKKWIAAVLVLALALSLAGCGRRGKKADEDAAAQAEKKDPVVEVAITQENLWKYFEYKEYPSIVREDNGRISSVQVSYGLALREPYTAANLPQFKDTMSLTFTARGVVKTGDFTVDYDTLRYTGTEYSAYTEDVTESLAFWPTGNRTYVWTFGVYSETNISYLEDFRVLSVSGSIFLNNN